MAKKTDLPFTQEQISLARQVPLLSVLDALECYIKQDSEYRPTNRDAGSIRVEVSYLGKNFRFILTKEKWINELMDRDMPGRGGGGAIDFYKHITGASFIAAVSACMEIVIARKA
jgi:hypothetical protein